MAQLSVSTGKKSHPKDTQVIVLDLRKGRFYKTFEQGDLRVTIFGDCQNIGEDRLQVRKTLKDDALALMGAIVLVPGIAAYCNKHVARNEELIEAASRWNEKNASFMKRIIHVIESEGGLSKAEKEIFDKMAFLMVKNEVEQAGDGKAYCSDAVNVINSGQLDLDKMEETKASLARVMDN